MGILVKFYIRCSYDLQMFVVYIISYPTKCVKFNHITCVKRKPEMRGVSFIYVEFIKCTPNRN